MTDAELSVLEHFAKEQGLTVTLELIAELRQARAEMDFILEQVDEIFDADDLLQAAKEAVCRK